MKLKTKSSNIEKTIKRLKAIEDITYTCSDLFTSDLSTITHKVLKPFCELTDADYGIVLLLTSPEKQIYLNATYGLPNEFMDTYNNKLKFRFNSEKSYETWPSIRSILKKQIVLVKDTNQLHVGFSRFFSETINPHTVKSLASVPIIINNKAVGAVTKYFTSPHEFDDEEISFMKTTANIITSTIERNQLVVELAKANEELKLINKELDSFVYIASHDLREPLRTIESFVSIFQDKAKKKLSSEEEDYLLRIVRGTQKMRKLIEDLTNVSRASRDTKEIENEVIDLNDLLTEVQFELTAFLQNKNASIFTSDNFPKVRGNKEKISSVFKNLIANGIKFNQSQNPYVKIKIEDEIFVDQNKICLSIEDNGIGIKKEYEEKIFGLFQRLHSQDEYEGTGAGLAIVKKILEKYNCKVWLESNKEMGSKFYFTLPKAEIK